MEEKQYSYMIVSNDEYELPIAIAPNLKSLAKQIGVNPTTVSRAYKNKKPVRLPKKIYGRSTTALVVKVDTSASADDG